MHIVDLVTPWATSLRDHGGEREFRLRHADLFGVVQRQRAPTATQLATPPGLEAVAARLSGADETSALHAAAGDLARQGWRLPERVILWAGAEPGPASEVIPHTPDYTIVLFLDRVSESTAIAALVQSIAIGHRWTDPERQNAIARIGHMSGGWDRWQVAQDVVLAEWIYTAGIAVHALADHFREWSVEALLNVSAAEFTRLRTQERALRSQLEKEMDGTGIGPVLRWLSDEAPPAMRRSSNGRTLPPAVGRYLGWRLTRTRVQRVGALAAATMSTR